MVDTALVPAIRGAIKANSTTAAPRRGDRLWDARETAIGCSMAVGRYGEARNLQTVRMSDPRFCPNKARGKREKRNPPPLDCGFRSQKNHSSAGRLVKSPA